MPYLSWSTDCLGHATMPWPTGGSKYFFQPLLLRRALAIGARVCCICSEYLSILSQEQGIAYLDIFNNRIDYATTC